MSRIGKIARLPQHIRNQLNSRLQDGEAANKLLPWLNALPEVADSLKAGRHPAPITEQNLSDWRLGGYQDWLRHKESCAFARSLYEEADDLSACVEDQDISDTFAPVLAAGFARCAHERLAAEQDPEKHWTIYRETLHELARLRRDDHRATRTTILREQWKLEEAKLAQKEREERIDQLRECARAPYMDSAILPIIAAGFGGGDTGKAIAARLREVARGLAPGSLTGSPEERAAAYQALLASLAQQFGHRLTPAKPAGTPPDAPKPALTRAKSC